MKTLRLTIVLLFIVLAAPQAFSQESKVGFRAGVNFASLSGEDADLFADSRVGIKFSIVYDYVYTERLGIETGFFYSDLGVGDDQDSNHFSVSYLGIPLLAKIYIKPNFNVFVGPQFALAIGSSYGKDSGFTEPAKIGETSALIGAEYKANFGLIVSVGYRLGLTQAFDEIEEYNSNDFTYSTKEIDAKNNAIQIGVGYLF